MVEDNPSRRLAHSVHRRLEDMIFTGKLHGGEVITERRLAEALEVSRTPLRDALLMLESEGLLKRRGTRYLEVRQMTVPEYMQILNIRRLLEPEAVRLSVGRIDRALLADVRAELEAVLSQVAPDGKLADPEVGLRADTRLHDVVADAAGNPLMASMIRDLRRRTRIFDLGRMPDRAAAACQEHLDIVAALEADDGAAAAAAMVNHIDAVKASIIRHLSSI
ncbi:DNA-binding transcriptional regulator, GntR family [Pseudoxanthobacter soli DSM 19599]|uniref:DNA-binding transcriptional regulator, GntR family n=1 Tax=Pseudoxanthobacter soli DSM 19599 TaxID=1123029 RepID=A0A1M7ZSB5_9HYPH|nr:GntR family transcriptional regulator [Pseudoxanthobacter soli]SHO67699.1 DNA-binding transcriptional regulator, GntR family [Pseudoxanthobacter soli DSM 19599]